jgi:hypothetical protein
VSCANPGRLAADEPPNTVRCGKSRRVDSILGASGRNHRGACDQATCQGTVLLNSFGSFAMLAAIRRASSRGE